MANEVAELLKEIKAGRLIEQTVSQCNSGKKCRYKSLLIAPFVRCVSAVPCSSSTYHRITISRDLCSKKK